MWAAYHSLKKWNKVQGQCGAAGNGDSTLLYMDRLRETKGE